MRNINSISAISLLLLASFAWPQATQAPVKARGPSVAVGSQGVVVSGRPAATAAGIKILEQGGNAADAGAATLLALSVTYVGAFCVGGEIPILVYSADQKNVKLLEGQGEAPRDPKAIAWYMQKGGFLRKADLAAHKTPVVDPLKTTYRGYTVYKAGALTQGPYLSQTLRLLEGFDLKKMGFNSADYIHTVIEAEKLALADRDEYYGDPNFVKVPMQQLLSAQYTEMRRKLIDPKKASLELRPGDPYTMKPTKPPTITGPWHGGTTVMCVTDKFGNVIAATPSGLSSTAGVAGRTGIIHGSRLSSLNTFKGTPNVIQPGKRPRITLSPTLLFHDNQPVMAISVAGGDQQDQAAIQVILNYVEFGMSPEEAFKAPRFSTMHFISSFGQDRASLGSLSVPKTLPEAVQDDLRARGHVVTASRSGVGGVALIGIDPKTKHATAVG